LREGGVCRGSGRREPSTGHDAASDPDAEQEDEQDERERVGRAADDHREDAGPRDFVEQ